MEKLDNHLVMKIAHEIMAYSSFAPDNLICGSRRRDAFIELNQPQVKCADVVDSYAKMRFSGLNEILWHRFRASARRGFDA